MENKTFEGMVYPDTNPLCVHDEAIRYVHMFDVPASLREHARRVLDMLPWCEWWTVGEFRYQGEDFTSAVARRGMDGRVTFGVEI